MQGEETANRDGVGKRDSEHLSQFPGGNFGHNGAKPISKYDKRLKKR